MKKSLWHWMLAVLIPVLQSCGDNSHGDKPPVVSPPVLDSLPPVFLVPPEVRALGAIVSSGTSVTLQGSVNPKGIPTTFHFEYGSVLPYGYTTEEHDAGSGISAVVVSALVTNLPAIPRNHWRLVAVNAGGVSVTPDSTFILPLRDESFDLGVGSSWTYQYKSMNAVSPGPFQYTSGVHTWHLLGSAPVYDNIDYTLRDDFVDTVSWNPQIHPDTIISGSASITIVVSSSAITITSDQLGGFGSVPRFVGSASDTTAVSSQDLTYGWKSVWVRGKGMVEFNSWYSIHSRAGSSDMSLKSYEVH